MTDFLLPKLNRDHQVPSVSKSGIWKPHKSTVLNDIGEGLKTEVDGEFFDVDSIPDVWARPILFQMALYDDEHPLHEKIVGEWRGLAALIALKEWRGFSLEAQLVDLTGATHGFGQVAARLTPDELIFTDTSWEKLYCLLLDGRPIGITSPTTLFCTAEDYSAHVPWCVTTLLRDPLRVPGKGSSTTCKLSQKEGGAIVNWLRQLRDELTDHWNRHGTDNKSLWDSLLGVIGDFEKDLHQNLGSTKREFTLVLDALGMSSQDAFRYIDEIPQPPQASARDSHVVLNTSRDRGDGRPILVIDDDIAEQWNVKSRTIQVWGHETLDSLISYSGIEGAWGDIERRLRGAKPMRREDFFTEKLYLHSTEDVFDTEAVLRVKSDSKLEGSPVLPLKEELLDYFTPQELASRLRIKKSSGSYRVSLRLTLAGIDGSEKDFVLDKEYGRDHVEWLENIPILELWPNFSSKEWDEYYTFYQGAGAFYASPYPRPEDENVRQKHTRRDEVQQEITRSDVPPEAMRCYERDSKTYAGLLLLRPPQEAPEGMVDKWYVGVDFGTTNTTVYVRDPQGSRAMVFENRLQPVIKPQAVRAQTVATRFLPSLNQPTPFHTLYQTDTGGVSRTSKPLLDGQILYINSDTYSPGKENQVVDQDNVHNDLKWSTRQRDKILTRKFLEQLCLQVRAEAAANGISQIEWSYSVPTSFSRNQQRAFERNWERIVDQRAIQQTESLSTAVFFMKEMGAPMQRGAVCIDIGGFSSDIAIWQGGDVKLQSSLRFASRHIFLDTISADWDRQIQNSFKDLFNESSSLEPQDLEVFLMSEAGPELMNGLTTAGDEPAVKLLGQYVALGVSGLLYYAGLLLRYLVDKGAYDSQLPYVYIGGNGAKMLYWLDHGDYDSTSPTNELFKAVLSEASGLKADTFKLDVTPREKMKHEVGVGLVEDHTLNENVQPLVLAGEAFQSKQQLYEWDTALTPEMLKADLRHRGETEMKLQELIDLVNGYAASKNSRFDTLPQLSGYERAAVTNAIDQYLSDMAVLKEGNIDVEPLFIVGLKKYVEVSRGSQ